MLIDLGVDAVGINFWPRSKRYQSRAQIESALDAARDQILRVGVFVNEASDLPQQLLQEGLLDLVQFHGEETPEYCHAYPQFIRAFGVNSAADLDAIQSYRASAVLLDAPAPGVYGGTGKTFDWNFANQYRKEHPSSPLILAGGITPVNAAEAISAVRPAALDVASGSESAPGIKDPQKVEALLACVRKGQ